MHMFYLSSLVDDSVAVTVGFITAHDTPFLLCLSSFLFFVFPLQLQSTFYLFSSFLHLHLHLRVILMFGV